MMNNSVPTSPEEWRQYWQAKGFPWRTEPEIDAKRQEELSNRRATVPDIEKGHYPFKGMKLSRADVEWLLASHENGRGPVDWNDESQRGREGLDLRGADLCQANLSRLPLAHLLGSLTPPSVQFAATEEQRNMAVVHLQGANLIRAQLQRAKLNRVDLQGAYLESADLQLTDLSEAKLQGAHLFQAHLQWADLSEAKLQKAYLSNAKLQKAYLFQARLRGARLGEAQLQGASLVEAQLQGAQLYRAQLQGAYLGEAQLQGANLQQAFFDNTTRLERVTLGDGKEKFASLADVNWGDVNLAVVEDWSPLKCKSQH